MTACRLEVSDDVFLHVCCSVHTGVYEGWGYRESREEGGEEKKRMERVRERGSERGVREREEVQKRGRKDQMKEEGGGGAHIVSTYVVVNPSCQVLTGRQHKLKVLPNYLFPMKIML